MSLTETQFAETFLKLLSDSPIVLEDNYRKSLNDIQSFPNMPPLPVTYSFTYPTEKTSINASFKSIKAPKFTADLELTGDESVYKVKEALITQVPDLNGFQVDQLKFLIKGKVIQDANLIGSVYNGEDLKFTVMISGKSSTPTPGPVPATTNTTGDDEPEVEVTLPWTDISQVLKNSGIIDVEGTIARLQKGWELTK